MTRCSFKRGSILTIDAVYHRIVEIIGDRLLRISGRVISDFGGT